MKQHLKCILYLEIVAKLACFVFKELNGYKSSFKRFPLSGIGRSSHAWGLETPQIQGLNAAK